MLGYLTHIQEGPEGVFRALFWLGSHRAEWLDFPTEAEAQEWLDGMVNYYTAEGLI